MPLDLEKFKKNTPQQARAAGNVDTTSQKKVGVKGENWFLVVRADPKRADEAVRYYETILADAHTHAHIKGNLENLLLENPGLRFFYHNLLNDAMMIERVFTDIREIRFKQAYEELMVKNPSAKTTELSKMAAIADLVTDADDKIRLFEYYKKRFNVLVEYFDDRKYSLHHIVTVRENNLQEVFIDSTKETDVR